MFIFQDLHADELQFWKHHCHILSFPYLSFSAHDRRAWANKIPLYRALLFGAMPYEADKL